MCAMPVLWLCGPPGVGKTTAGWRIFNDLADAGTRIGYVDIDQLGICYPEPPDDPDRYRMKARNLTAVVETFRLAGARGVVVSGVVDPHTGVRPEDVPNATLTVVRLRAEPGELTTRFRGRGMPADLVDDVLREAEAYDRTNMGVCVDTSSQPPDQVVRMIRERIGGWPGSIGPAGHPDAADVAGASGPVVWLCGATGVGKSTVGYQISTRLRSPRAASAFVDLDQIGFLRPPPAGDPLNHRIKARNLAALWRTFRQRGAESLVVVGPVDDHGSVALYTDALPGATLTLVRLHAGRDVLTERIRDRGRGGGPPLAGDELVGLSDEELSPIAEAASVRAEAMERAAFGDLRVDTDGRTVDDLASAILAQLGEWPRGEG